jgi:hypothetical protein
LYAFIYRLGRSIRFVEAGAEEEQLIVRHLIHYYFGAVHSGSFQLFFLAGFPDSGPTKGSKSVCKLSMQICADKRLPRGPELARRSLQD